MRSGAATPKDTSSLERAVVAVFVAIFMFSTWRTLTMFFSGDDMMNMYKAWGIAPLKIWKAQLLPWMPLYRPLGTAVYRVFYTAFGFHPLPLYIFGWALLIVNVLAAWRFFRAVAPNVFEGLLALSLVLIHGGFQDLYLSTGMIYDRFCFLFTVLAVTVYARVRRSDRGISFPNILLLCFICLMAMNSKESGASVPVILFCYELVYCLPDAWRESRVKKWAVSIAPFYFLAGAILAAFIFGRVRGTSDLMVNPSYQPHFHLSQWLARVGDYLDILFYHYFHPTAMETAIVLAAMLALAGLLRSRAMAFGWLFFVIAITPVATISMRQGFVLYVPELGLGLYFAALIGLGARLPVRASETEPQTLRYSQLAILAAVTLLTLWVHSKHWPAPWVVTETPVWRLTEKMRRDYPTLKPGAKVLFVKDYFPPNVFDALFNLQLLYGDPHIEVARFQAPPDQQPDRSRPLNYDLVFTTALDTYVELDNRDIEQSIKLNILKDHLPGRHFDTNAGDRAGYLVSGVLASGQGSAGWWTEKSARLKFDVYPADSMVSLKFFVPHPVATGKVRNMTISVNGEAVGHMPLTSEGMNEPKFPVPARDIHASGFTILGLDVDDPYKEGEQEFGVVLVRADFDYVRK